MQIGATLTRISASLTKLLHIHTYTLEVNIISTHAAKITWVTGSRNRISRFC